MRGRQAGGARRSALLWQVLGENTSLVPWKVSAGLGRISTAVFAECV